MAAGANARAHALSCWHKTDVFAAATAAAAVAVDETAGNLVTVTFAKVSRLDHAVASLGNKVGWTAFAKRGKARVAGVAWDERPTDCQTMQTD
jgi:hypothetical protein